ncbi:hypothetical protein SAMN02745944_03403 [Clostridium magnum DSM 2767]|nr:hypothetical protein SAMN02745944_03403 [Clostridium magnum DSM 2767]
MGCIFEKILGRMPSLDILKSIRAVAVCAAIVFAMPTAKIFTTRSTTLKRSPAASAAASKNSVLLLVFCQSGKIK